MQQMMHMKRIGIPARWAEHGDAARPLELPMYLCVFLDPLLTCHFPSLHT